MPRAAPRNTPPVARCAATTRHGTPCRRKPGPDGLCPTHRGRHRPTVLTPELQRIIVEALKTGNTRTGAAQLAGINIATFYRWLERGEQDAQHQRPSPYREFREAVARAEAQARQHLLERVLAHAEDRIDPTTNKLLRGDWRAAAWLLERRWPDEFGERQRIDATITPIQPRWEDPQVAELAERVLERRATSREG